MIHPIEGGTSVKVNYQKTWFMIMIWVALSLYSAPPAWGATLNLNGIFIYNYDIPKNMSILDTTVSFNSLINENSNMYASVQYVTPQQPNAAGTTSWSAYFTYDVKPNLGKFTVGYFDDNLGNLNMLLSAVDSLKSYTGLKLDRPINNNLSLKLGYYPNEQKNNTHESAYTIGLNYLDNHFGAAMNLISFGNSFPLCYTTNFYYMPNSQFRVYNHYGSDQNKDQEEIVGFIFTLPLGNTAISTNIEYNFIDTPAGTNSWAYRFTYIIDKNIALSYYRTMNSSNYNYLRLIITW
jgi:hypothetical protein